MPLVLVDPLPMGYRENQDDELCVLDPVMIQKSPVRIRPSPLLPESFLAPRMWCLG